MAVHKGSICYSFVFYDVFPSKFICFPMFFFTFFYIVVTEFLNNFFYCSFSSLYRLVVLSANVSVLLSLLISCMSFFSFFWNLLCTSLNFIMFNKLNSSFSNAESSLICGWQFRLFKP